MTLEFITDLFFLIGALAFIWGLRLLSSPDSARRGNIIAGVGMGMAILAALFQPLGTGSNNYVWIIAGMLLGGILGWISARKVQMTAMPQMVSIFNGLGGACAVVLASAELYYFYEGQTTLNMGELLILYLALLIGAVAFTGSMLAFAKLQGLVNDRKISLPYHNIINLFMLAVLLGLTAYSLLQGKSFGFDMAMVILLIGLIYGFSFVAPIGGADMPVVISLLNSFSGLSAAAAGFAYDSRIMIVGGILVGAAGTILTILMCDAMNRSLLNVLIGGFGGSGKSSAGSAAGEQVAKEVSLSDAAIQLFYANSVVIVPGYGLAVAQAQMVVKELDNLLEANGVEVKYGIHPVAGRMPGHMNVLLAEADIPYPKLLDLEAANEALAQADLAVIIGANDVVNPAAENEPSSPIYGMPVLQVWKAKNVIVLKRSMNPGYAGIQNPLFFMDNTRMLFGDAKDTLNKLVSEVKNL